jgi:hypothetical protein
VPALGSKTSKITSIVPIPKTQPIKYSYTHSMQPLKLQAKVPIKAILYTYAPPMQSMLHLVDSDGWVGQCLAYLSTNSNPVIQPLG